MLNPQWMDTLQVIASIGTMIVGTVGFLALIYQIRQVERAIRGQTHGILFSHAHEVLSMFKEYPELRPYFYENREIDRADPLFNRVMGSTTLLADLIEHACLQRSNLPKEVWVGYENYIKFVYRSSPAMRAFIDEFYDWYSDDLLCLFPELLRRVRDIK